MCGVFVSMEQFCNTCRFYCSPLQSSFKTWTFPQFNEKKHSPTSYLKSNFYEKDDNVKGITTYLA